MTEQATMNRTVCHDQLFVVDLFNQSWVAGNVQRHKKVGRVICRPTVPGETIITMVSGKVETLKKAETDGMVVRNIQPGASAEQYIISGGTFVKRYEMTGDVYAIDGQRWEIALPTGECEAFVYHGETIHFTSPWKEPMLCEDGDCLCRVPEKPNEVYRIEKGEFARTYTFIKNVEAP